MKESVVVDVFARWLEADGWVVQREVAYCDLVARRDGDELRVEAKGDTESPGLDVDTLYGQLLRRMVEDEHVRYAVVGPERTALAMSRVPRWLCDRLGVAVYCVRDDHTVWAVTAPTRADFESRLQRLLRAAADGGVPSLEVRAGDLHRDVGGYPGNDHRMPVCCSVMRAALGPGDRILEEPPCGDGATLLLEYRLPRP